MDRRTLLILGLVGALVLVGIIALVLRQNNTSNPPSPPGPLKLICSGNGTMDNKGACTCFPNFSGGDCSGTSPGVYYITMYSGQAKGYVSYDALNLQNSAFLGPLGPYAFAAAFERNARGQLVVGFMTKYGSKKYLSGGDGADQSNYLLNVQIQAAVADPNKASEFMLLPTSGGYYLQYMGAPDAYLCNTQWTQDSQLVQFTDTVHKTWKTVVGFELANPPPMSCAYGNIVNGACQCLPSFVGADCSMNAGISYYITTFADKTYYVSYDPENTAYHTYLEPSEPGSHPLVISFERGQPEGNLIIALNTGSGKMYLTPGLGGDYSLETQIKSATPLPDQASQFHLILGPGGYYLQYLGAPNAYLGVIHYDQNQDVDFTTPAFPSTVLTFSFQPLLGY